MILVTWSHKHIFNFLHNATPILTSTIIVDIHMNLSSMAGSGIDLRTHSLFMFMLMLIIMFMSMLAVRHYSISLSYFVFRI